MTTIKSTTVAELDSDDVAAQVAADLYNIAANPPPAGKVHIAIPTGAVVVLEIAAADVGVINNFLDTACAFTSNAALLELLNGQRPV